MNKVYVDDDMLESYPSYNAAADAFLEHIAFENITLDTDIQVNLNIGSDDVFSTCAMEAIGETVKNMASKAKSNIVTYSKKLINFLFGWLIEFFKGSINIKKAMAKSYEKARTYLKKLNELERAARSADKESEIEITDFGNCVVVGLVMTQGIMWSIRAMSESLKSISATEGNDTAKSKTNTRAFEMLSALTQSCAELYALIGSINISNTKEIISSLKSHQYDVGKMLVNSGAFEEAEKKYNKVRSEQVTKVAESRVENNKGISSDEDKKEMEGDVKLKTANSLQAKYKGKMEETVKYMSDPDKATMSYSAAYDELRIKLDLFINISKANKWDMEKYISGVEKVRRGLMKEVNNMNVDEVNEKTVSTLLQKVIDIGNSFGQVKKSAGEVVKRVVSAIDGMTTDVAKLGSKLVKIGGND